MALVVVGAVLAAGITWVITPLLEARNDRAVEKDQRERLLDQDPLGVHVQYDLELAEGHKALIGPAPLPAEPLKQLLDREGDQAFTALSRDHPELVGTTYLTRNWLEKGHALNAIQVELVGRRALPITIRSIKARILSRKAPLTGVFIDIPSQGDNQVTNLGFDLDSENLLARRADKSGALGARYGLDGYITLEKGEPIVLNVFAHTATCFCEWDIEMVTATNGTEETMVVDDEGKPFRTTAMAGKFEQYVLYDYSARPWRPRISTNGRLP